MLSINQNKVQVEARSAAYTVANSYLALNAIIGDTFSMPPARALVYVTVIVAAVQRAVRSGLPDHLRDSTPLPDQLTGYISRRALAAATGLSRETVRRLARELLADGLLTEGPRGGLAAQAGILAQPEVQRGFVALVSEFGATANQLLKLGVFEVSQ